MKLINKSEILYSEALEGFKMIITDDFVTLFHEPSNACLNFTLPPHRPVNDNLFHTYTREPILVKTYLRVFVDGVIKLKTKKEKEDEVVF